MATTTMPRDARQLPIVGLPTERTQTPGTNVRLAMTATGDYRWHKLLIGQDFPREMVGADDSL